jgi:hypothetical protein
MTARAVRCNSRLIYQNSTPLVSEPELIDCYSLHRRIPLLLRVTTALPLDLGARRGPVKRNSVVVLMAEMLRLEGVDKRC